MPDYNSNINPFDLDPESVPEEYIRIAHELYRLIAAHHSNKYKDDQFASVAKKITGCEQMLLLALASVDPNEPNWILMGREPAAIRAMEREEYLQAQREKRAKAKARKK